MSDHLDTYYWFSSWKDISAKIRDWKFAWVDVVMDMQWWFFLRWWGLDERKKECDKLCENIAGRVEHSFEGKKLILLVEFDWYGETSPIILKALRESRESVIHLTKWNCSLLSPHKTRKEDLEKICMIIWALMKAQIKKIWLFWINTSACVLKSAKNLESRWFFPQIPLGYTLNFFDDFEYGDNLSDVLNYDLSTGKYLRYWRKWKKLKKLSDYL